MDIPSLPSEVLAVEKHFEEIESVAEEILSDKEEIITLDKRRNSNREALRQLKFHSKNKGSSQSWICLDNMFMRLPKTNVITCIETEQEKLETEILNLRNGLRTKVNNLNKLEGKPLTRGTGLKALSKEEWDGVKQVLGS